MMVIEATELEKLQMMTDDVIAKLKNLKIKY